MVHGERGPQRPALRIDRDLVEGPEQRLIKGHADEIARALERACGGACMVAAVPDVARAGGGALPMADIPTTVVALQPLGMSANDLEARLRLGEPCIVTRIKDGRVLVDPRTLTQPEEGEVVDALARLFSPGTE